MTAGPVTARFPTLDDAESALDWIGLEFGEGDGAFDGELDAEDRERLEEVLADPDTPPPVRALAESLTRALEDAGAAAFRVTWDDPAAR